MTEVLDFNKRRFDAAKDASETTPEQALVEALRRVRSGEWPISHVMVIGMVQESDGTFVQCVHGGSASTNECLGLLYRTQHMLLP